MDDRNPPKKDNADPVPQGHNADDGVDVTLIRWMLSLSPTERLRVLEENVAAILRLRSGRAG